MSSSGKRILKLQRNIRWRSRKRTAQHHTEETSDEENSSGDESQKHEETSSLPTDIQNMSDSEQTCKVVGKCASNDEHGDDHNQSLQDMTEVHENVDDATSVIQLTEDVQTKCLDEEVHVWTDDDYSSSDIDSNEESVHVETLQDELRDWSGRFGISAAAIDGILSILKKQGHPDLPTTARSLLKTPRTVETSSLSGMNYFHFGFEKMIVEELHQIPSENLIDVDKLDLAINVDGCPLFKSSSSTIWPVLCRITNIPSSKVFPISVGVANTKPSNLDFLNDAVADLNEASVHGIQFGGKQFKIFLRCITCDAPARAMVKRIKHHSGFYGCDKCCEKGVSFDRRVIICKIRNLQLRTDESFRDYQQAEHHHGESPLVRLIGFDMVQGFPLDYMHSVCLGVMRKLLLMWMRGPRERCTGRLSATQQNEISGRLVSFRKNVPREFARKPRGLSDIDRWKATEFRQFLLYSGQFVLKGVLESKNYKNFLGLSVAISILLNEKLCAQHNKYAHDLLQHFVYTCSMLYGRQFLIYNVHSLLHISRDAEIFGTLDKCAAWAFENYMQCLKKKVRSGRNPLVQIVKRTLEVGQHSASASQKKLTLHCNRPDNAVKTADGKYVEIVGLDNAETHSYRCRVYYSPQPAFIEPCDSRVIGICQMKLTDYRIKFLDLDMLTGGGRCMLVEDDSVVTFLPLLHDY